MDLTPYVDAVRHDLAAAAEAGGPDARALAERITAPLESALRLALLDALSAAAGEITRDLAPGSVDLRLRGREPSFVVTPPSSDVSFDEPDVSGSSVSVRDLPGASVSVRIPPDGEEGAMARINLRLAEDLKGRVEDAARQAGLSVNAWLVRSAAAALGADDRGPRSPRRAARGGERYMGWVR